MGSRLTKLAGSSAIYIAAMLSAQAADMPAPAPYYPPPAPLVLPFSWTGFYVGGNLGYAWANSQWSGGAGEFEVAPRGFLGGGTLGYNIQTGLFVWGIEGDLDFADLNGTANTALCATCQVKDTWLGTMRGRIGYSFDHWLPYLTAGGAWGHIDVDTPVGSADTTKGGWAAGAGVEYAWGGPWSAKLEYLYVDLGDAHCAAATCGTAEDVSVHFTANVVRAGLNYRF